MNLWRMWMFVLVVGLIGCTDETRPGVDEKERIAEEQAIAQIQKLEGWNLVYDGGH